MSTGQGRDQSNTKTNTKTSQYLYIYIFWQCPGKQLILVQLLQCHIAMCCIQSWYKTLLHKGFKLTVYLEIVALEYEFIVTMRTFQSYEILPDGMTACYAVLWPLISLQAHESNTQTSFLRPYFIISLKLHTPLLCLSNPGCFQSKHTVNGNCLIDFDWLPYQTHITHRDILVTLWDVNILFNAPLTSYFREALPLPQKHIHTDSDKAGLKYNTQGFSLPA